MLMDVGESGRLIDVAKVAVAEGKGFRGIHVYDGHAPYFPDAGGRQLGDSSTENRADLLFVNVLMHTHRHLGLCKCVSCLFNLI